MRGFRVFAAVLVILCLSIGVASAAETI